MNRSQEDVIDYLRAENEVLREHVGGRRLRFTDLQRRRLAAAAKRVGRGKLFGIEPAPERGGKISWERFLKAHWGAIGGDGILHGRGAYDARAGSLPRAVRH